MYKCLIHLSQLMVYGELTKLGDDNSSRERIVYKI